MSAPMTSSSHSMTFSSTDESVVVVWAIVLVVLESAESVTTVESTDVVAESDVDVEHAVSEAAHAKAKRARFIGSVAYERDPTFRR